LDYSKTTFCFKGECGGRLRNSEDKKAERQNIRKQENVRPAEHASIQSFEKSEAEKLRFAEPLLSELLIFWVLTRDTGLLNLNKKRANRLRLAPSFLMVAPPRIELGTRGFSVLRKGATPFSL